MTFLIILTLLIFSFVIYKSVYFKPVTAVVVSLSGSVNVVSVKPNRSWFSSISCGNDYGVVKLSTGIYAVYVDSLSDVSLSYKDYRFTSDLYIFRYSKFKLRSVDLSDRVLSDSISHIFFS